MPPWREEKSARKEQRSAAYDEKVARSRPEESPPAAAGAAGCGSARGSSSGCLLRWAAALPRSWRPPAAAGKCRLLGPARSWGWPTAGAQGGRTTRGGCTHDRCCAAGLPLVMKTAPPPPPPPASHPGGSAREHGKPEHESAPLRLVCCAAAAVALCCFCHQCRALSGSAPSSKFVAPITPASIALLCRARRR